MKFRKSICIGMLVMLSQNWSFGEIALETKLTENGLSLEFEPVVKPLPPIMSLPQERSSVESICYLDGSAVGCILKGESEGFYRCLVNFPEKTEVLKCQTLSEIVSLVGLPIAANEVSASWSFQETQFQMKYWKLCQLREPDTPVQLWYLGALVTRTSPENRWHVKEMQLYFGVVKKSSID